MSSPSVLGDRSRGQGVTVGRGAVPSWALLEFALAIWSALVVVIHFPLWLVHDVGASDAWVAVTTAAATLLLMLIGPLAGSASDRTSRRPFLLGAVIVCAIATMAIGRTGLAISLVAFVVAAVAQGLGLVMLDALLPSLAPQSRLGRTSAIGIAASFAGSLLGTLLSLFIAVRLGLPREANFLLTGGLVLLLGLPPLLWLPGRIADAPVLPPRTFREGLARFRRSPDLARLLVVHLFAAEAAGTLIRFVALYAVTEVGLTTIGAQMIVLTGIVGGLVGSPLAGHWADRHGSKSSLAATLWVFAGVSALIAAVPLLNLPTWLFWVAAFVAGGALAGSQTADRSLLIQLAPPEAVGEVVGFYSAVGRAALIVGPLVWALIVDLIGWGRPAAMLSLGLACLVAFLILRPLRDPEVSPPESLAVSAA